jgi:hypothetical protein
MLDGNAGGALSLTYAPHEHAQHPCDRVLSVACPGFLTVADIKGDVGATRGGAILFCHLAPTPRPENMPRPPRCLPGDCQLAKTHLECGAGRRRSLVPYLRRVVVC